MFSKICSPLHEHELQEVDPMIVYGSFAGHWKCDHCDAENNSSSHPFHCRQCSFDLCYSCVYSNINEDYSVHRHPLYYVETSRLYYQNQNGLWRCAVCKKTSHTLRETFSFHCPTCPDFDICRKCYVPWQHPIHRHVLRLVDTSLIYTVSGGSWVCDVCGHQSRPFEKFSRHCEECEFDVCQECFKPQNTPLHPHPLYKANSHDVYAQFNGGWRCDNCRSVHNNPLDHFSWHCPECEYDLCQDCMGGVIEAADQTGPSPARIGRTRGFQTHSALSSRQPEENPWVTRDRVTTAESESNAASMALITEKGKALAFPEDTDDNSKCIICMEQPKNATIIHGDTGHCCCCLQCAQVLKLRGDPCPICRAPIDHVIRQFNA